MRRTIGALGIGGIILATNAAAETIKVATWNIENFTEGSRAVEELSMMAELVDILDADVIAMQEVDGPEAAQLIFDPNEYEFHFSSRPHEQRTGFAIRRGLAFTAEPGLHRAGRRRCPPRHRPHRDAGRPAGPAAERASQVLLPPKRPR